MTAPFCFNCACFVPEGMTHNDLQHDQWDECTAGDCRRHSPIAGEPTEEARRVNYAYWPIVLATDWCGEHLPKHASPASESNPTARNGSPRDGCLVMSSFVTSCHRYFRAYVCQDGGGNSHDHRQS